MITIKEAEEILKKEYHLDNFTILMSDILLPDFLADEHDVSFKNQIFSSVTMLGESSACEVTVFEVYLNEGTQNRRVAITQEMFRVLRGLHINNALVAFVNADKKNYRISLLTSKYEFDGDKIVKILSNPRRLSYSLGHRTKTKTAYKFLIEKGKVSNFEELVGRFSVEVVNKQFYAEIATAFTELVGGERNGRKYEKTLDITGVADHNKYAEFGVRLIGRIMFCWFLREKRSDKGIPLVPDDMLSIDTIKKGHYYNKVLEPLFFELLNTNQKRRRAEFKTGEYVWVPYLNGGLFSPQVDDHYKYDDLTQSGLYGQVKIPDEWFVRLYSVLGEYNFTVDENTAYDIELSIDPEMLGRIFENLLAEINPETGENAKKSTGSFYTPRDIVDYMVDSSLCEYLKTKTGIEESKLHALLSYFKEDDESVIFSNQEKRQIIDSLSTVTILDPACGSGAFPIGMLQKIVYILQVVDPEARLWLDKIIKSQGFLVKKEIEKKFGAGLLNYIRKLSVIQNSIFGIDIQPIAVEISRLRCFLSLIIEEKVDDKEENRGIEALPNLDFKFIIANSLLKLPDESMVNTIADAGIQVTMFENTDHVAQLKAVREEYFNAESDRRSELRTEFDSIRIRMFQETISKYDKRASQRYTALSNWSPFDNEPTDWFDPEWMFGVKNGFDIVIGNPPYGVKFSDREKDFLKKEYPTVPDYESADFFLELSYDLLRSNGIVCFIIPNMFLSNQFAKKFRKTILSKWGIIGMYNLSQSSVFESASVRNAIVLFSKNVNKYYQYASIKVDESGIKVTTPVSVNKSILTENIDNWLSLNDIDIEAKNIIQKICFNSQQLSRFCSVSQGLIPYDKYQGHSEETIKNRIWNASYKKDETYKKELQGKDISRYSLVWNGKDWLSYGEWLAAPRRKEFFTDPRILIREITNPRILATYTQEEYYNTPSIINCIEFNEIHPLYLLAIINSSVMSYYHIKSSPKAAKGLFPKILVSDVRKLPIKIDMRYCDQIVALVEEQLNHYLEAIDEEIDSLVYKIYGLTNKEQSVIDLLLKQ